LWTAAGAGGHFGAKSRSPGVAGHKRERVMSYGIRRTGFFLLFEFRSFSSSKALVVRRVYFTFLAVLRVGFFQMLRYFLIVDVRSWQLLFRKMPHD
jgi:hypothetical protein